MPSQWKYEYTIDQYSEINDPSAILKRITITSEEGLIDLDIWQLRGLNFDNWLEWYSNSRIPLPQVSTNATLAGQKALVFVQDKLNYERITTFFSDKNHVYRIWYPLKSKSGLDVYQHIVESVEFDNGNTGATVLPADVLNGLELSTGSIDNFVPLSDTCCGYSSPGNPFPCCQEGGVDKGNCTWWVYYKFGYVPFRYDAGEWYSQTPDYPGWSRGSLPGLWRDNIAWWSGDPGHVAFLPYHSGGSTISISEMLWCTSCYRTRSISISNPEGYMYPTYLK